MSDDGPVMPRGSVSRTARLASLPLGAAGRATLGLGKRLSGRPADDIAAELQARTAEQLFAVLGQLKGGAMKLGQTLSVFEAAVPEEIAAPYREALVKLQRRPDGPLEERYVNFVYQPTFDYHDNITGIFVEGSDVTEAVHAHQALRESEERLRQLANTIPQLAWISNPDGAVNWYNDRWYEYTGKTFEEMQGWGWEKVHHPDRLSSVTERWKASIASGQLFEMSFPIAGQACEQERRDQDPLAPRSLQVPRRQLAHFARAHQHHRLAPRADLRASRCRRDGQLCRRHLGSGARRRSAGRAPGPAARCLQAAGLGRRVVRGRRGARHVRAAVSPRDP